MNKELENNFKKIEREIPTLIQFTENTIRSVSKITGQLKEQETQLYWTSVKASNNRAAFSESDRKDMERLLLILKALLSFQDEILQLTEGIRSDIRRLENILKEDEKETKWTYMRVHSLLSVIYQKVDILREWTEKYNIEQKQFVEDVNHVSWTIKKKIPLQKVVTNNLLKKFSKKRSR